MIEINFSKWFDFFFIAASGFVVAGAGNYFFQWDFKFCFLAGIILSVWSCIYDMISQRTRYVEKEETEEQES